MVSFLNFEQPILHHSYLHWFEEGLKELDWGD
jgi:hypothetical protein